MDKVALLFVSLLGITCAARADPNGELNKILEDNAVSAAYARMCDEEPISEAKARLGETQKIIALGRRP